jgi:hypothetical protein
MQKRIFLNHSNRIQNINVTLINIVHIANPSVVNYKIGTNLDYNAST